jgi:hypothetical protein
MAKKIEHGIRPLPVDSLFVRKPWFPILEIKSYPEANPNALEQGARFFSESDFVESMDGTEFGYRDPRADSIIPMDRLDPLRDRRALEYALRQVGKRIEKQMMPAAPGGNNFGVKDWGLKSLSDSMTVAAYNPATQGIYLNTNRGSKKVSFNIYALRSAIGHELIHFIDRDRWDNYSEKGGFTFKDHAEVYLKQMQDPEFARTPLEFQSQAIAGYIVRLWNYIRVKRLEFSRLDEYIREFNEGIGKKLKAKVYVNKRHPFYKYPEEIKVAITDKKGIIHTYPFQYQHIKKSIE